MDGKALTVLAGLGCYVIAFAGTYFKAAAPEAALGLTNVGSLILGSLFLGSGQTSKEGADRIAAAAAEQAADRIARSVFPEDGR